MARMLFTLGRAVVAIALTSAVWTVVSDFTEDQVTRLKKKCRAKSS